MLRLADVCSFRASSQRNARQTMGAAVRVGWRQRLRANTHMVRLKRRAGADGDAPGKYRTVEALVAAHLADETPGAESSHRPVLARLAAELAPLAAPARSAAELHASYSEEHLALSTGLPALDAMLDGGLFTGEVYELAGASGTGKTQLCMAVCAQQAAATEAGVLYVGTSRSFCAERVYQLARTHRKSSTTWRQECKDRLAAQVRVESCARLLHVLRALEALSERLEREPEDAWNRRLRLLIVDSPFAAYMGEYSGLSQSSSGAQTARLQDLLRHLATRHALAVLVTNTCAPSSAADTSPLAVRMSLGVGWQQMSHVRLLVTDDAPAGTPGLPAAAAVAVGPEGQRRRRIHVVRSSRRVCLGDSVAIGISSSGLTAAPVQANLLMQPASAGRAAAAHPS